MAEIDKRHLDYRVVDRYISKGAVKESEYRNHLKGLPDQEENAEWVQMDLHDTMGDEGSEELIEDEETSDDETEISEEDPTEGI